MRRSNSLYRIARHVRIGLVLLPFLFAACPELCRADDRYVIFHDDFNGSLETGWSWIRENPATWELTATHLRIELEYGDLWSTSTNNCRNLLIRPAPAGDFTLEVHLTATLVANYNQALMVIYGDDDNYLRYGLIQLAEGRFVNHVHEVGGSPRPQTHTSYPSDDVYLRLELTGATTTMWYSADGLSWIQHATLSSLDFGLVSVGLVAFDGSEPPSSSVAHYDYFTVLSSAIAGLGDGETSRLGPVLAVTKNPVGAGERVHLDFSTSCSGRVVLQVFDVVGGLVATVLDEELPVGRHRACWSRRAAGAGQAPPAGLYYIALTGSGARSTARVVLLK